MFDYQTRNKSNITSEFQFKLARFITRTPIPILLDERRDYSSYRTKESLTGYQGLMENQSGYIKHDTTTHFDFGGKVGERPVRLAVFKSDAEVEQDDNLVLKNKKRMFTSRRKASKRAVFFTVNGQVHGDLGLSFVQNRCDLYHIGSDMVAFVDFSDLLPADFVDLFRASRDRLADKEMAQRLQDGMESILTTNEMLQEEEQRRREKFTKDKREEKMGDMLEDLIERNPELLDYLNEGEKIPPAAPNRDRSSSVDESDYAAPYNPDTFKIITGRTDGDWDFYDGDSRYEKDMPTNRNRWMRFYLNAPNDFFEREDEPGTLRIVPKEVVRSYALRDGLLSIQLEPLPESDPGMSLPVTTSVVVSGTGEEFQQNFTINYTEAVEETEDPGDENDLPPVAELDLPPTNPIYQEDWEHFPEPFDAHTPVRIQGKGEDMEFYINYDAAPVKNFLSRYNLRKTGKETIKETWKAGIVMYTLSTFIELRKEFDDREDIPPKSIAEVSMRGVVQSMLDQHISSAELEELTV